MEIDDRCPDCVNIVCCQSHLLDDRLWTVGADGRRHWAKKGEGVCGVKTLQPR